MKLPSLVAQSGVTVVFVVVVLVAFVLVPSTASTSFVTAKDTAGDNGLRGGGGGHRHQFTAASSPTAPWTSSSSSSSSSVLTDHVHSIVAKNVHRTLQQQQQLSVASDGDGVGSGGTVGGSLDADEGLFCRWIEAGLGEGFVVDTEDSSGTMTTTTTTVSCSCDGSIATDIMLSCDVDDVCGVDDETQQQICGDLSFNMTLSDVWDTETSWFGEQPTLRIGSCLSIDDINFLDEQWCITLSYYEPTFAVPKTCDVTYGGQDCTCDIDEAESCYTWDCAPAVQDQPLLADIFKSGTCLDVQWEDLDSGSLTTTGTSSSSSSSTTTVTSFLPSINQIPPDVEAELTANAATDANNNNSGGSSLRGMGVQVAMVMAASAIALL